MNGKGDTPRPLSVDEQTFADNWQRTFGPKPETPSREFGERAAEVYSRPLSPPLSPPREAT